MQTKILFLAIFLMSCLIGQSQIKVASVLGDNMVLQRNTEVKIWGKAKPGEKLTVKADWNAGQASTTANDKGNWMVKLKTTNAGGPYTISISTPKEKVQLKNILLGEVWLCSGQSNMEMSMAGYGDSPVIGSNDLLMDADNDQIRLFNVTKAISSVPVDTCTGKWSVANGETASVFSAVGYMYARLLQQRLKVPVGVISSDWGGSAIEAWMSHETILPFTEAYARTTQPKSAVNQRASNLYNGMISPIINYAIKGAIWYQGESNIGNYRDYVALQAAMVANWRKDFGVGEFPFYFVQIAPYWYGNSKAINSALQRDEQLKSVSQIPNSGMVCTLDIGEEKNIHPAEKMMVAKRLALWALAETYGIKGIMYKSPAFSKLVVKDTLAVLSFDNVAAGLSTFGKEINCFEIAGQDSIFYPAKLAIKAKQANVWSSKVKAPVAVRYAFSNFPVTNGYLYNTAGLPVPSFRTDNWGK
ncbi:MAG: sialate O-acetylesterase [Prolixibacteraceae bacterium]|nr:sialate O-acetylesterase [Prolixibacteraceae bacterium]